MEESGACAGEDKTLTVRKIKRKNLITVIQVVLV